MNFIKDFKGFISKGNVFDMAVGIIMGSAFTAIVKQPCPGYTFTIPWYFHRWN